MEDTIKNCLKFVEKSHCCLEMDVLKWKYLVLMSELSTFHGKFQDAVKHMTKAVKLLSASSNSSDNEIISILQSKLCAKYIMSGCLRNGLNLSTEVLRKNQKTASPLVMTSFFYNLGCLLEVSGISFIY
ncbi:hypothetical protein MXB_3071 [Myxobolus squamalis]|nr:hypothetical protein MXB_3071 [Myxobolus squamalis]